MSRGLRHGIGTVLLGISLTCLPPAAQAQTDEAQARAQLEELQREIARIGKSLQSDRSKRDKLREQLRAAELELGQVQRGIRTTTEELERSEQALEALDRRRDTLRSARDRQQARVAAELRTAWQLGREGEVKVLLNQEQPHTLARALAYYRYFFEARNTLISEYRDTLAELGQVQERILDTNEQLERQRAELEQRREQLAEARKNREQAVAALSARIQDQDAALKAAEKDRADLENLLASIERAVNELDIPDNYQDFAAARGKMSWPVTGKPSNRFGRARNAGKMRWQGVTIPAKEGATVRAIHHGRVVYADWFRGSGLLLIIDHGDGYMSLYAHNESLLREVGEWVAPGTPVSTVGNSGGLEQTALYFEIRHQGKPVDPARWCQG